MWHLTDDLGIFHTVIDEHYFTFLLHKTGVKS